MVVNQREQLMVIHRGNCQSGHRGGRKWPTTRALLSTVLVILVFLVSSSQSSADDDGVCHADDDGCLVEQIRNDRDPKDVYGAAQNPVVTWALGFFFVTVISAASCIGLLFVPTPEKDQSASSRLRVDLWHNTFEGLALGSLLASAIFHLIPHAFDLMGEDNEHHYLDKSLLVFGGVQLFFLSERLMVLFGDYQAQRKRHGPPTVSDGSKVLETVAEEMPNSNQKNGILASCSCSHQRALHEMTQGTDARTKQSNLVLMVILGDGLHNFIDGLSLGAALSDSHLTGFSIALAILFEEIPHELGDFAILIASGMSARRAAAYNFASASTCYLGMAVGIVLGEMSEAYSANIFALAGGMFLYISLFSIMVELNERFNEARKSGLALAFRVLFLQNTGILVGIVSLYHLAKFDETALVHFINKHTLR